MISAITTALSNNTTGFITSISLPIETLYPICLILSPLFGFMFRALCTLALCYDIPVEISTKCELFVLNGPCSSIYWRIFNTSIVSTLLLVSVSSLIIILSSWLYRCTSSVFKCAKAGGTYIQRTNEPTNHRHEPRLIRLKMQWKAFIYVKVWFTRSITHFILF